MHTMGYSTVVWVRSREYSITSSAQYCISEAMKKCRKTKATDLFSCTGVGERAVNTAQQNFFGF